MTRRGTTGDEAIDTGIKPGGKLVVSLRKKIFAPALLSTIFTVCENRKEEDFFPPGHSRVAGQLIYLKLEASYKEAGGSGHNRKGYNKG